MDQIVVPMNQIVITEILKQGFPVIPGKYAAKLCAYTLTLYKLDQLIMFRLNGFRHDSLEIVQVKVEQVIRGTCIGTCIGAVEVTRKRLHI